MSAADVDYWRDLAIQRGRELALVSDLHVLNDRMNACENCGLTWPCETRRALDGEAS